jgi:hypothetical protein
MSNKVSQQEIEKIYLTCVVKDLIHTRAYSGDPAYKWLDETWSVRDILETLRYTTYTDKEESVQYLLDIAHLFGKDR